MTYSEPSLAEVIRVAIDSRLLDVHTSMVCKVVSYDHTKQLVDLQPVVRRPIQDEDGNTTFEELPTIPKVKVLFPCSGSFQIAWPVSAGDFMLLVCSAWDIGGWRSSGGISDANNQLTHDLSFGMAIPCALPNAKKLDVSDTAAVIDVKAPVVTVDVGKAAADFVALASKVEKLFGDLAGAILNATPVAQDGGAAILTTAKATLSGLGWAGGTTPPADSTAATKLRSE